MRLILSNHPALGLKFAGVTNTLGMVVRLVTLVNNGPKAERFDSNKRTSLLCKAVIYKCKKVL